MTLDARISRWRVFLHRHHRFLLLVLLVLAMISRLALAAGVSFPGIADPTYYYTVAENLADGRGFQVDYIWHYLVPTADITHAANDYWAPLPALVMAAALFLGGKSLLAALIPSILLGLAVALLTWELAKALGTSGAPSTLASLADTAPGDRYAGQSPETNGAVAYYAAGLSLLLPALFFFSLRTDTAIYYACFANLGLLGMVKGMENPRFFLLAAVGAALAQLCRLDGVLLAVVLVVAVLVSPHRRKWLWLLLVALLYLAILSPWLVDNVRSFGMPLPPGSAQTAVLTDYEEIYSYSTPLSLQRYLAWGAGNIFWSKTRAALQTSLILGEVLGPLLGILAVLGLLLVLADSSLRQRWRRYLPPLLFSGLLFAFYIGVATFPAEHGSFLKSVVALAPFLVIMAVAALERLIASETARILIVLLLAVGLLGGGWHQVTNTTADETARYRQLVQVGDFLRQAGAGPDTVVMTRYPWDVYYATRFKAIQIPNEDLEMILAVARRYGAGYLLLPAPRTALTGIYAGTEVDPRLQLVLSLPEGEWRLFAVEP
jgi:4-amino-4-deoxy-L-arabinose transferase-like glycosyltransferase